MTAWAVSVKTLTLRVLDLLFIVNGVNTVNVFVMGLAIPWRMKVPPDNTTMTHTPVRVSVERQAGSLNPHGKLSLWWNDNLDVHHRWCWRKWRSQLLRHGLCQILGAWWWNQLHNTTLVNKPLRVSRTLWKDVWSKLLGLLTDVSWLETKQL